VSARGRKPLWRTPIAEEVEKELAFHLEMTTRNLMERGMTEKQARAEAERRFGNVASVDTECRRYAEERDRHLQRAEYRYELLQDVAFAWRQLLKTPTFAAITIITLTLGIGATAAVFSILNAVALRPLPFDHPDRVTLVYPTEKGTPRSPSVPEFLALRDVRAFEQVAATILQAGTLRVANGAPEAVGAGRVSANYFAVFGVKPILGRTFSTEEDAAQSSSLASLGMTSGANVAVISDRLWRSHFDAEPSVVGRVVSLDGRPTTIIGVMPRAFDITRESEDLWIPLALPSEAATRYAEHYLQVFARVRDGVTLAQAQAAATTAERVVAERIPGRSQPIASYGVALHRYVDDFVGDYRALLLVLLGAVGFVLLIACSNVANLLLARGTSRAKELAIRAALGAGRGRLVRQLLTESLLLALIGSVLGLTLAFILVKLIVAVSPTTVPRIEQAGIDYRVLLFTLAVGVTSSIVFGLLPAIRSATGLITVLREGGRSSRIGRDRLGRMLVMAEVALAITLLVGSGLLIRSAWLIEHVDPGFDSHGVLTARLVLPETRYPDGASINRLFVAVREAASRIPGVQSTALVLLPPLSGDHFSSSVSVEGVPEKGETLSAALNLVSDGYFGMMRIRVLVGRDVDRHDVATSPNVVVINQALARKLWPTRDLREAIGRRINAIQFKKEEQHVMTVVGVVADSHNAALDKPATPELYAPATQTPEKLWPITQRSIFVLLLAANRNVDPEAFARPLRDVIAHRDPSLPIAEARSLESFRKASLETARMNTILLSILGGIALVLAMGGIYGVVSYFVSQRIHEIGIRMALGATPGRVWSFVMQRGLVPILAGGGLGFALSVVATTVLREQLYGVSTHDPATLGAVGLTLLSVALIAMYLPARRAMRVPPIVALNDE
jgi:predicted permease